MGPVKFLFLLLVSFCMSDHLFAVSSSTEWMGSGDYSGDALWVARTKKALGVDQALLLSKLRFLVGGSGQQAARDRSSGAAIANGPRISDVALQGEDSSFWPASDHKIDQDSSSKLNSPFWAARGKKSEATDGRTLGADPSLASGPSAWLNTDPEEEDAAWKRRSWAPAKPPGSAPWVLPYQAV